MNFVPSSVVVEWLVLVICNSIMYLSLGRSGSLLVDVMVNLTVSPGAASNVQTG